MAIMLKGEILIVKNHPFVTFPNRHPLDVGKQRNWNSNFSPVSEAGNKLTTQRGEVQILDA